MARRNIVMPTPEAAITPIDKDFTAKVGITRRSA